MAGSAFAQNSPPGYFFLKGSLGQASASVDIPDDRAPVYMLSGGYRWQISPTSAIGIESGYGKFGKFATEASITDVHIDPETPTTEERAPYRITLKGLKLGLNGAFQFAGAWQASLRGGWLRADNRSTAYFPVHDMRLVNHSRQTGHYLGAGIARDLTRELSVGLDYDYYNIGNSQARDLGRDYALKTIAASAEYRF